MNTAASDQWMGLLSRLNSLLLGKDVWRKHLTDRDLSAGWCGRPPASEHEIDQAEKRLGVSLPQSYREFLAVSNGWRPFNSFLEWLLPVHRVDWLRLADPEGLAMIRKHYPQHSVTDNEYLDYETPEHNVALRPEYYADCILVGTAWEGEGEMVLLNSDVRFNSGEWETIFFADWLPGNERYRSFRSFVEQSIQAEEEG